MNLKDILNPETCEECKFLSFDNFDMPGCNLGVWSWDLADHRDNEVGEGFDYKKLTHKDCPLPRIKCENCNRYVPEASKPEDKEYYCLDRCWTDVPCIEFEEVG